MAYFSCMAGVGGKGNSVIVTCDAEFAGIPITCTNGQKTYTKVCPSFAPYEVTFTGLVAGTWTISATLEGVVYSTTTIVTDITAVLLYGFNWQMWVDSSSSLHSEDYTDLADLLSDEAAIRQLFTEHAPTDYAASTATITPDLATVLNNDLCAKWINLNDYALDYLHANPLIAAEMNSADKYFYGEWVIVDDTTTPPTWGAKGNVPIMTSETAPYGTVVNNGTGSTTPYTAFNGVIDSASRRNYVQIANNTGYIGYKFTNPISVKAISWRNDYDATTARYNTLTAKVKYSDDGTNWTDAESLTITPKGALEQHYYKVSDNGYHLYWAFFPLTSQTDSVGYGNSFQFYGRELKSIVPIMTEYTTPYGTVTTSSDDDSAAWRGFRGISDAQSDRAVWSTSAALPQYAMYESPSKWVLKAFKYENNYDGATTRSNTFELLISNDGTTFDNLGTFSNQSTANYGKSYYDLSANNNEAKYFKINGLTKVGGYFPMGNIQFYGLDYTEKEFENGSTKKWLYDHGLDLVSFDKYKGSGTTSNLPITERGEMYCEPLAASGNGFQTFAVVGKTLDLTNYSRIRLRFGSRFTPSSGETGSMKIFKTSGIPSGGSYSDSNVISSKNLTVPSNEPDTFVLDVSSIAQSAWVSVGALYYTGRSASFKELWLE